MKIIYRGGYDKNCDQSIKNSAFYEYSDATRKFANSGKRVAIVTFAKPDHYYDSMIQETMGSIPDIINMEAPTKVIWSNYNLIFIPGGTTETLKAKLLEYNFNTSSLKKSVIVIGDSAGAYVLSKYYASLDGNSEYHLANGLYPESNIFTIGHINNPNHFSESKLKRAEELSKKAGVHLLLLRENEAKLFENGKLFDFHIDEVLR